MFFILFVVIALVAWALHLMQEAIEHKEFSLMLAGFLVSAAAAALIAVYFLMSHYVGYMSEMTQNAYLSRGLIESADWVPTDEWIDNWISTVEIGIEQAESYPSVPTATP